MAQARRGVGARSERDASKVWRAVSNVPGRRSKSVTLRALCAERLERIKNTGLNGLRAYQSGSSDRSEKSIVFRTLDAASCRPNRETAMPRPSVAEKRATFRRLHESGCFVIPNPWDVGSARYLQGLGFKALASTSSGFAWSVAHADNAVGVDMVLAHLKEICAADRRAGERRLRGRLRGRSGGRRGECHALLRDRRRGPLDRGLDRQQGQAALRYSLCGRAHEGGARRDRQGRA